MILKMMNNMDWQKLHDIALVDMANKIGCDQVLDDLISVIPMPTLEEYLKRVDEMEDMGIFKENKRKVTMTFVVKSNAANHALYLIKQGEMSKAAEYLNSYCEESDYDIENID